MVQSAPTKTTHNALIHSQFFVQQELELLPAKELQNSVYIKHSVSLEQVSIMNVHCTFLYLYFNYK